LTTPFNTFTKGRYKEEKAIILREGRTMEKKENKVGEVKGKPTHMTKTRMTKTRLVAKEGKWFQHRECWGEQPMKGMRFSGSVEKGKDVGKKRVPFLQLGKTTVTGFTLEHPVPAPESSRNRNLGFVSDSSIFFCFWE
jgi:hypothetical protein